jgi:hypothetical protein
VNIVCDRDNPFFEYFPVRNQIRFDFGRKGPMARLQGASAGNEDKPKTNKGAVKSKTTLAGHHQILLSMNAVELDLTDFQ